MNGQLALNWIIDAMHALVPSSSSREHRFNCVRYSNTPHTVLSMYAVTIKPPNEKSGLICLMTHLTFLLQKYTVHLSVVVALKRQVTTSLQYKQCQPKSPDYEWMCQC